MNGRAMIGGTVLALGVLASGWVLAAEEALNTAEARLRADVSYLADDAREGRAPGTKGIEAAADYIAEAFRQAGLKPAPGADGYFQPFTIPGGPTLGKPVTLAFHGPEGKVIEAANPEEFTPLAIGGKGTLHAVPIVFAGYGITAKESSLKLDYDDYEGIDVKGKAVLIVRREPQQDREEGPFAGRRDTSYATFRHKVTNAYQHGAAAVLFVNDFASTKGDPNKDRLLHFLDAGPEPNSDLPFVMLKRRAADDLLAAAGAPKLETLEREIDSDLKPRSRALSDWTLDLNVPITREPIETKNVVGVLEGSGPLADETIVIGAHYDHLGRGGPGSLAPFSREIHNGADDNASGTSMVIEMARRLAKRLGPLPRRVVFMAFSGEERGLLGSAYYVRHPLYPLDQTIMMVNFDMVGRLNGRNELTVYGTGTSPGIEALVEALGTTEGFKVKKIADGYGPSDQSSFYRKDIPVVFLFTGTHADYHRPSDDPATINFAGMARIADYAELLLLDLVRRPHRPEFTKVARRGGGQDVGRIAVSVYLGTIPDYDESVKGVKLSGVRDDSPAEKAGLREGDIIVKFGGKPISTIYDYTESLGRYKPGDQVEVVVQRNGKETTLTVTLGSRPGH